MVFACNQDIYVELMLPHYSSLTLYIYDILAAIKMRFDMGLHHDDAVIVDIVEIIQELFDRELILYKEFSPHVN